MNNKTETERLSKTRDVSRACQVTDRTVQNWKSRGIIPFLKIGRCVRYDLKAVLEALRSHQQ